MTTVLKAGQGLGVGRKDGSLEAESRAAQKLSVLAQVRVPSNKNKIPEAGGYFPPFPLLICENGFSQPARIPSLGNNFVLLKC